MSSDHSAPPPCNANHKNCADKFKQDNEAEYIAREKNARHLIREVENHNATHPKLHEEIRRKRSLANVIRSHGKSYCKGCKRRVDDRLHSIRKRDHSRRKPLTLHCLSNTSKPHKVDRVCGKYMTPKNNSHWSCPKCTKKIHMTLKCVDNHGLRNSVSILCDRQSTYHTSNSTMNVTICPDSKDPSVSSYHSFGSNNQEPLG